MLTPLFLVPAEWRSFDGAIKLKGICIIGGSGSHPAEMRA